MFVRDIFQHVSGVNPTLEKNTNKHKVCSCSSEAFVPALVWHHSGLSRTFYPSLSCPAKRASVSSANKFIQEFISAQNAHAVIVKLGLIYRDLL